MKLLSLRNTEVIEEGVAECVQEPMGHAGLEGYDMGAKYPYQKLRDSDGEIYFRIFHEEVDPYDTCGPGIFNRFFQVIDEPEAEFLEAVEREP